MCVCVCPTAGVKSPDISFLVCTLHLTRCPPEWIAPAEFTDVTDERGGGGKELKKTYRRPFSATIKPVAFDLDFFFLPLKASRRELNRVRTSERLFFIISLTPLPSFDGLQPTRPTHAFRCRRRRHRACTSIAVYVRRTAVRHCLFNGSRPLSASRSPLH